MLPMNAPIIVKCKILSAPCPVVCLRLCSAPWALFKPESGVVGLFCALAHGYFPCFVYGGDAHKIYGLFAIGRLFQFISFLHNFLYPKILRVDLITRTAFLFPFAKQIQLSFSPDSLINVTLYFSLILFFLI